MGLTKGVNIGDPLWESPSGERCQDREEGAKRRTKRKMIFNFSSHTAAGTSLAQLKSSVYQKYVIPVSLGLLLLLIFKLDQ